MMRVIVKILLTKREALEGIKDVAFLVSKVSI